MLWEIILAVILAIGIFTTVNEVRLKRAARKSKAGVVQGRGPTGKKTFDK